MTEADGHAERDAALLMVYEKRRKSRKPITLGADKAYDIQDFVRALREMKITPHVAQNDRHRKSAIDGRTTRHAGYQISQAKRYWVEKPFGWMKSVGPLRKVKLRGRDNFCGCSPSLRRRSTSGEFRSCRRQHAETPSARSIGLPESPT